MWNNFKPRYQTSPPSTLNRNISGARGEVKDEDYRQWPVFKRFRETTLFLSTYQQVFDKEFLVSLADVGGKNPLTDKTEGVLP